VHRETHERRVSSGSRSVLRRLLRHENAVLVIILLVLVGVFGGLTKGVTLKLANVTNIMLQSSTRGVAALGQAFVMLTAGIDLSVGGIALMTSVIGATLLTERPVQSLLGYPIPIAAAIFLMLMSGLGVGLFNGALVSRLRIPALIVTLGVWQMTRGGAFQLCGGYTILSLPDNLRFLGQGTVGGVPVPAIIFISLAVISYLVLNHTSFGRIVYAAGGNPVAAWLSGINIRNTLLIVYTISGFLAGLAGAIIVSRVMSGSMNCAIGLELDSVAAVVIGGVSLSGGRGTVLGVVLGAIIIGIINNGMVVFGVDPALQDLVKGAIIVAAVGVDIQRRRS